MGEYQTHGEVVVSERVGPDYTDAQIGLIIATATIRRDMGKIDAAIHDIEDAIVYAENIGHDELITKLQAAVTELQNSRETEPQPNKTDLS